MAEKSRNYRRIVALIYLLLPYTLIKQKLFWRFRKPSDGLPDFICIGAQKAATTWLHEQLKSHPDLCLPEEKEVHYFDWFFYRSLSWYRSRFQNCRAKKRGEVTPGYSVIETGRIRFIRRIMPDVRIVLILRDPVERAWSSARFHFGKELKRDLSEVTEQEFLQHFSKEWVKKRGDYIAILSKWKCVFPKENILVLLNENIDRDPAQNINEVFKFIGVAPHESNVADSRFNVSAELEMPVAIRNYLRGYYAEMVTRLREEHGVDTTMWSNYKPE